MNSFAKKAISQDAKAKRMLVLGDTKPGLPEINSPSPRLQHSVTSPHSTPKSNFVIVGNFVICPQICHIDPPAATSNPPPLNDGDLFDGFEKESSHV